MVWLEIFTVQYRYFLLFLIYIHSPSATHRTFMPTKGLIQSRHQADEPTVQLGMVNNNATLCHYLFEIAQVLGIRRISRNTLRYDIKGIKQVTLGISDK
ncbi:hypothetical protein AV650_28490 (plasmid) [Serratia fonticola]|nr:hypothetical protein AV650_28490 [Serratia fonticola]